MILELVDLDFDTLLQLPRSILHLVILGRFGHNIIKSIIHLIAITIIKKEYKSAYNNKGQPGYRKAPIPENVSKGVVGERRWPRWSKRAQRAREMVDE